MDYRRFFVLLPLVLMGFLASATGAQAAFGVEGLDAAPANTDAGAHADFHTHLDITSPDDQLRDLTVSLPPGLSGNPQSVPKCPVAQLNADTCPVDTQIGTTTAQITASSLIPLAIDGSVYNVVPGPGEPARLGIILRPPDPTHLALPPIVQQVQVKLRSDFGLDTILTDLPQNAQVLGLVPVPIAINSVDLNLNGSFMRNPTSCGTQTTRFTARSWAMAANVPAATGEATYASTNCTGQTYTPKASLEIKGVGETLVKNARPTVTSVITQTASEANNKRAEVVLPSALGVDASNLANTCAPADFQAGSCADATQVGNATAVSPLLDSDLTGPVYLVTGPELPQVGVDLRGALPLKILGSTNIQSPGRLVTIFDGLPDLPLSRFELVFPGGPGSLLVVIGDVCADSSTFNADFTSQADQTLSLTLPTTETGCPTGNDDPGGNGGAGNGQQVRKPSAKVRVRGTSRHRPRFSVRVKSGGAPVRAVRVKLPRALKLRQRAERRVVVKADGKRVRGRKRILVKGRTLKLRHLPGKGAKLLTVKIRRTAIKHPRKVRKGKKLTFRLKVLRPGQKPVNLKVRSRARR